MQITMSYILFALLGFVQFIKTEEIDYMKKALDDIEVHYNGAGHTFNQTFYDEFQTCLDKFGDDKLKSEQQNVFKGLHDYWISNGTSNDSFGLVDHWGECTNGTRCPGQEYMEFDTGKSSAFGPDKMLAMGPCNYVSNIAYYHSVTKICDYSEWSQDSLSRGYVKHLKQAFASQASGSAFFHASMTVVGLTFDNDLIAMIAYFGHQMLVQNLKTNSSIIHEISAKPRNQTSFKVMEDMMESITDKSVPNWVPVMVKSDYPNNYQATFGAIVVTMVALGMPAFVAGPLNKFLVNELLSGDDTDREFLLNFYLPELKLAVVGATGVHFIDLLTRGIGVIIKLLFAFLFQEKVIPLKLFKEPWVISLGGHSIQNINGIADDFTGFEQSDWNTVHSKNLYPGQDTCKYQQGHSVWHEVSANGLLDLVYLCDYVNKQIKYEY